MKLTLHTIGCLAFATLLHTAMFAQDGLPDPTFGNNGVVQHDLDGKADVALGMALQPDGKVVVCGSKRDYPAEEDLFVARFNSDGSLDTDFASNGWFEYDHAGGSDVAWSITVRPDGRLVVVGTALSGSNYQGFVLQLDGNGTLDPGFGQGGLFVAQHPFGSGLGSIVLLSDGSLVGAGSVMDSSNYYYPLIVKLDAAGELDTSFGTGGATTTSEAGTQLIHVSSGPGGSLVASGNHQVNELRIFKLSADGTLDPAFGTNGVFMESVSLPEGEHALLPSGKVLISGQSGNDLRSVRLLPDGTLDANYGTGGVVNEIVPNIQASRTMVALPDGRFIVGGRHYSGNAWSHMVVRFLSDGSPDPSFGTNGYAYLNFSPAQHHANDIAALSDGKVVCVFGRTTVLNNDADIVLVRLTGTPIGIQETLSMQVGSLRCSAAQGDLLVFGPMFPDAQGYSVAVSDMSGRSVNTSGATFTASGNCTPCAAPLPRALAAGVYVASVADPEGRSRTCRFVLAD
ncbi:MAG: hypothetical protein IPJ76_18035 [Flavobacteriales bacterium]|nr:MAG: hypothetical protein IPJ76_18035 [Flavobacteriales bacterium]